MSYIPIANERVSLLDALSHRWQAWRSRREALAGLESCGPGEVARMAHDLTLTTGELRALAGRGANSASLLYRRMAGLGLVRETIADEAPKTLWDMQRSCSLCDSKRRCSHDFARGADPSAWQNYCPNDDTLAALAPLATTRQPGRPAVTGVAIADDSRHHLHTSVLGLLFAALAWLVLLGAPPAGLRGSIGPSFTSTMTEPATGTSVTCLDANCLTAQQRAALRTLRTIQTQGWIASSDEQLASLPQASRIVQGIRADQALACGRLGGTASYGLMYQNGCAGAAQLAGYKECRPIGGGACLIN